MSPETVVSKLNGLKNWNKMTASKREAIDRAIKAVEMHGVAKEIIEDGEGYREYYCPVCHSFLGFIRHGTGNYCYCCGQKLKAPRE